MVTWTTLGFDFLEMSTGPFEDLKAEGLTLSIIKLI